MATRRAAKPFPSGNAQGLKAHIFGLQELVDENYSALGGRGNERIPSMVAEATRKKQAGEQLSPDEATAFKLGVELRLLEALRSLEPAD